MQFINYWQQFEHTGRVEDYLNYLQNAENGSSSICRMNGRFITPCLFRRKTAVRLIL